MSFNPKKDKIAITVPEFRLKRPIGQFGELGDLFYNEPYLLSMAITEEGVQNQTFTVNHATFPGIRPPHTVKMSGDGHLVYGPGNPGEYVIAWTMLMENDQPARDLGKRLKAIAEDKAIDLGLKAIMVANPAYTTMIEISRRLFSLIANEMAADKDDPVVLNYGTFLRDRNVPYSIDRSFISENDLGSVEMQVLPLKDHRYADLEIGPTTVKA